MITKSKSKSKFFNFKNTSLLILFIFLLLVTYLVKSGFRLNLYNWAKETGQICIPGEVQTKKCTGGEQTRTCDSSGLRWSSWGSCEVKQEDTDPLCRTCLNGDLRTCRKGTNMCQTTSCNTYGCTANGCKSKCNTRYATFLSICNESKSGIYSITIRQDGTQIRTPAKCEDGKKCFKISEYEAECR